MKKLFFILLTSILFTGIINAQKVEVLYFKANLPCCHARACNNLESQVKSIIESNYENGEVVFRTIMLSSEENAELVEKHNARSQTVVIVSNKRRSKEVVDATEIVRNFSRTRNQAEFEKAISESISKLL